MPNSQQSRPPSRENSAAAAKPPPERPLPGRAAPSTTAPATAAKTAHDAARPHEQAPLLQRVRERDYVAMLGLMGAPNAEAVRLSVRALQASAALSRDEGLLTAEELCEVQDALADAEAVLLDPARGPAYVARQQQVQT